MAVSDPHIKREKLGSVGLLTLDRPAALNALTHGMIKAIAAGLTDWAADPEIRSVAIRGAGERAFCAGGDIRAVRQAVMAGTEEGARLLRDEYHMNALIASYPKPFIALLHGIVMGGGAGISVHGRYRLADASLSFAMPETGIGFIPDVGSSYFLSRCPDEMGMYLALTGAPIGLGEALGAGLATHAVAQADFGAVIDALAKGETADRAIAPYVRKAPTGPLAPHRRRVATIFSAASVEAILERLDRDGDSFARQTAQIIRTRSPSSLKLAFYQLRKAVALDLGGCLAMEYRLALRVIQTPDFREGVRAALVDKDRKPHWHPAALAGVGDLDAFFAPLGEGELFQPRDARQKQTGI